MLVAALGVVFLGVRLTGASRLGIALVAAGAVLIAYRMWGGSIAGAFRFKAGDENVEAIGHRLISAPSCCRCRSKARFPGWLPLNDDVFAAFWPGPRRLWRAGSCPFARQSACALHSRVRKRLVS
ncbi:hypothetical protein MES4922_20314 [Mesorhizobium ventifaucium]|uniref:Uncharacterized protein n=1 Tax=Mesorhizobium ventifaucium TaxID=666020 RepID=A0ABN8JMH2_9HYPH|nr:hypothetical protein MES4922_20314 [Mesorhizobium ventifaucium]